MNCIKCDLCGETFKVENRRRMLKVETEFFYPVGNENLEERDTPLIMDICSDCEKNLLEQIEMKKFEEAREKVMEKKRQEQQINTENKSINPNETDKWYWAWIKTFPHINVEIDPVFFPNTGHFLHPIKICSDGEILYFSPYGFRPLPKGYEVVSILPR